MQTGWGTIVDGVKTFPLHPGQSRVMQSSARFTAAIAGTGGGKTCMGPLWIIKQIRQLLASGVKEILGLVVAPTYAILNRATMPTLVEAFRQTDLEGFYSEAKKQYTLPYGLGTIWTLSADNPEGLEGGQYHFAWLDEGGQFTEKAWIAIQGRAGLHRAPVLITSTPYRLNWLKKEIVDRAKSGDPDYCVIKWRSIDNPFYPLEEYERAKRTFPPNIFRMRYDGEFLASEGLVFSSFNYEYNVRPVIYDPQKPILVGTDFNVNPMCWVLAHRNGDFLEVFDEIFLRNTTTMQTIEVLVQRYAAHKGGFEFYGDAASRARKTSAESTDYILILQSEPLKRLGRTLHIDKSNPRIQNRFASTNARLCNASGQRYVFIDPKCEHLISDLETRSYKEGTREPNDIGDIGHITDALGYIIYKLWPLNIYSVLDQSRPTIAVSAGLTIPTAEPKRPIISYL